MNTTADETLRRYNQSRNAALASLDEATIRTWAAEWGVQMPRNELVFWGSVHKSITAITTLPLELRRKSKAWLDEHKLGSWDDGDLGPK